MNYRHGFHAGNFADVLKHVVLARILDYLNVKEKAYRVIDTHAGAGCYDFAGEEALRTGEWRDGVGRMEQASLAPAAEALLAPWREAVAGCRERRGPSAYPGSPEIARHFMRAEDRLIAAELHPATFARLSASFGRDSRCKALALDGWLALRANVPPMERRGLVLIDPPFEAVGEFATMAAEAVAAHAKWPQGIYALWYPLKDRAGADGLLAALEGAGIGRLLVLELFVDRPAAAGGLGATGLVVINPPWRLASDMAVLLPVLAERLAQGPKPRYRCEPIRPDG